MSPTNFINHPFRGALRDYSSLLLQSVSYYHWCLLVCIPLSIGLTKLPYKDRCYVELFANSVSVSNANVSAADWRIDFVTSSPVTGCKISLHTLSSRLLRGGEVISNSSAPFSNYFGHYVVGDKANVVFDKVVMPEIIGDVIWNFQVEVISGVHTNVGGVNGYFMASCPNIPVKFTTDPEGKVMGSLFGNMRRCECQFRHNLDSFA